MVEIENVESGSQIRFSSSLIKSLNEEIVLVDEDEERVDIGDVTASQPSVDIVCTSSLANTAGSILDAGVVGRGGLETLLAGANFTSLIFAGDLVDVSDSLAVLAICWVDPGRRSNGATTAYSSVLNIDIGAVRTGSLTALGITIDVNAVIATSTVGETTDGLSSRASRGIVPLLGKTLRATSMWEVPAHPITLAVGWLADAVGGVRRRGRRVAIVTRKVARTVGAAEGLSVLWVLALLRTLLVLDLR